jgi:hypothetical protein
LKFDANGNYIGGTRLGGPGDDEVDGLFLGPDGMLFFSGSTTSTSGLPVTSNAFQPQLTGRANAFIGLMSPNLVNPPGYFSYFGAGTTLNSAIFATPNLDVVISGQTDGNRFPQNTQFPTTFNGGPSDGLVALFSFNPLEYTNPTFLQSALIGGSAGDLITATVPLEAPGGGISGLRMFGTTGSTIKSSLPGFDDCSGTNSMFFVDFTPFTPDPPGVGCDGSGIIEDVAIAPDSTIYFVADVNRQPPIPSNPITPFPTGTRSNASFVAHKTGFTDPTRFNGAISLEQVSWAFLNAQEPNSATGELTIKIPSVLNTIGMPFGFFNMTIGGVWAAQNVPIDVNNGVPVLGTQVLLRDPTLPDAPILHESVQFQVTPIPISTFDAPHRNHAGEADHRKRARSRSGSRNPSASARSEPLLSAAGRYLFARASSLGHQRGRAG